MGKTLKPAVLAAAIAIAACAPKPTQLTKDAASYTYEPPAAGLQETIDLAQKHCDKYGRRAVLDSDVNLGAIDGVGKRLASFRCVDD